MITFVGFLLLLYIVWDLHYFVRFALTLGFSHYFQKKVKLTDTTTLYSVCLPQDVDVFITNMNNARYLRELDFARYHFYDRTGIYETIRKLKGGATQGATNIRYRKAIGIFTPFKVETRLIWWDEKCIYLEQRFISIMDGFIRAVCLSKQCIIKANVPEVMKQHGFSKPPEIPEDLKLWLDSSEVSSQKLRKDK